MEKGQTREALSSRIVELRRARAAAHLDAKLFRGDDELREAERDLAVLDDAEGESIRRDIASHQAADAKRVATLRDGIKRDYAELLIHVQQAEDHANAMIASLSKIRKLSRSICSAASRIDPSKVPMSLSEAATDDRLARYLSEAFWKLGRGRFGGLEFASSISDPNNLQPWRDREDHTLAFEVSALTGEAPSPSTIRRSAMKLSPSQIKEL